VLGAIVILGTGAGIAFFMLMAHRSRDAAFVARTAETVVITDMHARRLSRTRSCRRATTHFSTAGFCLGFPVLAQSWLFSG
jgi:uncharacterized membrane protein